jgi:hypothetical protein
MFVCFATGCERPSTHTGPDNRGVVAREDAVKFPDSHVPDSDLARNVDASDGSHLSRTETVLPATNETAGSPNEEQSVNERPMAPLSVRLEELEGGFSLKLPEEAGTQTIEVQSVVASDNGRTVVHLIRRMSSWGEAKENKTRYRMDALVVNPAAKTYAAYPIADVIVADTYSVDSVTRAYGFLEPSQLVIVRPEQTENGRIRYDIVSMNIQNGQIERLIEDIPPASDLFFDHLGPSWMSAGTKTLYLNSYSGGKIWVADLKKRTVNTWDGPFKNRWPLFMLQASPDGERFWHENEGYRLYDQNGTVLASLPSVKGLHSYPAFRWSPDSRYSVYEATFDDNWENVLGGEDAPVIAPQWIRVFDRSGSVVWEADVTREPKQGTHMEWVGWLNEGGYGLLRRYELEREEGKPPAKVRSVYQIVDVTTGSITQLSRAERLEDLTRPEPVRDKDGMLIMVDRKEGRYWSNGEGYAGNMDISILSKPEHKSIIWAETDYKNSQTVVRRYDPATKTWFETTWNGTLDSRLQLVDESLLFGSDLNYRYVN